MVALRDACISPAKKKRSSWDLYGSAWFCCGACGSAGARHSWHLSLRLPWTQRAEPPHSVHRSLRLPCMQKALPPHWRHLGLMRPCWHLDPPHSVHVVFQWPCTQKRVPPQSRQAPRMRACSQRSWTTMLQCLTKLSGQDVCSFCFYVVFIQGGF